MVNPNDYPNFKANFQTLIDCDAIPDTPVGHLGQHVIEAIDQLSEQDIQTLCRVAKNAKAHLFVHDKDNHVIAMGL